ncbi:nucleoside deaminase [Lysobacter sp. A6]|uniref:Nucleoside deaminase n=1 Tax=Noviluteimonas lactosilytica TaxID=2888523 RepID=A0ABS8JKF6_9GAMM|nr:nucleoside deaminase [Lysobacter lactosilyticus]MCC8364079.1 nucleoside deaminase [Lysobacter lactosilyticus]
MLYAQVHLTLPAWVHDAVDMSRAYTNDADKVALAIELSRTNVEARTGGPFGAAIFGPDDRIVAVGVNRVEPHNCSVAHAEIMAFMLAQQRLQRMRLNESAPGEGAGPIVLATSSQPCCQCYGASFWAGIDALLIGARSEDVMRLTEFDEGPLPNDWVRELERRGIAVTRDLHRDAACDVLRAYGELGGRFY